MSKPSIQFNDYVSLAVMLLMLVALVAGQTDTRVYADDQINIAVVTELSHFRGEDE